MRRIFSPLVILLCAAALATSCLGDDDSTDITFYDDTAITSFTLGTLNRTMHTTSSEGEDSVYTDEVDGSGYSFNIDQTRRLIYNTDSLPVRTDAAHVLCTVGSKNGGMVVIVYKNTAGEDSLVYYNSSDSIDFTEPREFRVYSNSGAYFRPYTVSVNVHKEDPDSMNWHGMGAYAPFAGLEAMRAVVAGGGDGDKDNDRLLLFGMSGGETIVYGLDGGSWTELSRIGGAAACTSAVAKGDSIYTVGAGGSLVRSADGSAWDVLPAGGEAWPVRLVAAGREKLYGVDGSGVMVSSRQAGTGWSRDRMSGGADGLPSGGVSGGRFALSTDGNAERIIIAGNRSLTGHPEDSVAMVWSKIEEYSEGSEAHSWIHVNEDNGMQLPRLSGVTAAACGGELVAIGGRGEGSSTAAAFAGVYVSSDNGLTWHTDDRYSLPEGFSCGSVFAMAVDDSNFIWIVCGGTGDVWRGRLNRLGWAETETSFTK